MPLNCDCSCAAGSDLVTCLAHVRQEISRLLTNPMATPTKTLGGDRITDHAASLKSVSYLPDGRICCP